MVKKQDQQPLDISAPQVKAALDAYAETVESPSLRQFLLDAEVQLEGERVRLIVGAQMARGMIQQDTQLMTSLRETLRHPNLGMLIEFDPARAPVREEVPGGPTTPREIYEHLAEKNPLLHELRQRFDLTME